MEGTTGVLEIVRYGARERYEWNGNPEDRKRARAAFQNAMAEGVTLASVVDSPGKSTQVRTFEDIEKVERERGTVTVRQTAPLVGG